MSTLLCVIIALVMSITLESCDVSLDKWQYYVILACIIASLLVGSFLM